MSEDLKHIDPLFKQAAEEFSMKAPAGAWNAIQKDLVAARKKRFFIWFFTGMGAALLLIFSYFMFDVTESAITISPTASEVETPSPTSKSDPKKENNSSISTLKDEKSMSPKDNTTTQAEENIPLKENTVPKRKSPTAKAFDTNRSSQENVENVSIITKYKIEEKGKSQVKKSVPNDYSPIGEASKSNDSIVKPKAFQEITQENQEQIRKDSVIKPELVVTPPPSIDSLESANSNSPNDSIVKLQDPVVASPNISKRFWISYHMGIASTHAKEETQLDYHYLSRWQNDGSGTSFIHGLSIQYFIYKNWNIGFSLDGFNNKTIADYELTTTKFNWVDLENYGSTPAGHYSVKNIDDLFQRYNDPSVHPIKNIDHVESRIRMIHIPIQIGYANNWKKLHYNIQLGFGPSFITQKQVLLYDGNNVVLQGDLKDIKSKIYGIDMGLQVYYSRNNVVDFGFNFGSLLHLNSINNNPSFDYRPWIIRFEPSIRFKF